MSAFTLYVVLKLDDAIFAAWLLAFLAAVVLVAGVCVMNEDASDGETPPGIMAYIRKWTVVVVILALVATFLPTTKQAAAMWVVPRLAANETLHQIAGDGADIVKGLLEQWKDELAPVAGQGE